MSKVVSTFDVRCFKVIGLWQLISSSNSYSNRSENNGDNDYESNRSKEILESNRSKNISDNILKSNHSKNISDNIFENNSKDIDDDSEKKGSVLHDDDELKSNSSSYFYLLNVTVMSVFVPYVIMEFFGSMTSRYDFVTLTEKLSVNITLLESAVKFIYCYMRRKQLADLLGVFEENFLLCMQQNRAINLKILENYAKNLTGNINLFIIIIYATVGLWNSLPILSCFQESSCVTLQIMPSWYPISIDQAPIKQLVYLLEFVIMCYCASLLYSVNCLILAFARMISSQVEILKLSMTSLAQNATNSVYSQNAANSVYSQNAANSVHAQNAANSVYEKKSVHDFEVSEIYKNKDNHNFVDGDLLKDDHNARSVYGKKGDHNLEIYGNMDNHTLVNGDLLRGDYHIEESEILYRRYQKRVDDLQRDCLIDYQRILSQAALMEQTFSPLILFQLAVSTITLCLVLISLTTKTAANSTISLTLGCKFSMYLIFGLMELFVYSWCGHIIQDQTGSLHGSLYEMAWLSNSPKFKKNVLQAMTRALRPCRLTAGKFYPVDFKTFAGVLKMSYSMFTFLYGSGLKK